jgi:ubiquinone/menaquinone biosynthesis C-methylase UbiE
VDAVTKAKWDRAAANFDLMASKGPEWRWAPAKRELFSHMQGKILFLALGTGLDVPFFPPDRDIVAIDISAKMIKQAQSRVDEYKGRIEVHEMDVHAMPFEPGSFDQVYTSCTFCSVPDPVKGLEALRVVLKPGGELRMFEHTGSRYFPFNLMMNIMTPVSRRLGPDMNRPTVDNVRRAGFQLREVNRLFLDVVQTITATAPEAA